MSKDEFFEWKDTTSAATGATPEIVAPGFTRLVLRDASPQKITDISFAGVGKYTPQEDITPYELAALGRLFMVAAYGAMVSPFDYAEYVARHNLGRHFTP